MRKIHNILISQIQSVMLDKQYYTVKQAQAEIKKLGFEPLKYHQTENYHVFRIQNPNLFDKIRSKRVKDGILFRIGLKN